MRIFILICLSGVLLFGWVGKIVALRNEVVVKRDGKIHKANIGFEVEKNDIIISKDNAKAQIIFKDDTVITIGKNTSFKINDYLFDENKPKAKFSFFKGAFREITGKIGKIAPNRFKIKTPTASIGIRGTQILALINKTEKIACTEGKIIVITKFGSVEVPAGEITEILPKRPPVSPRPYKAIEIKMLLKTSGGDNLQKAIKKILIQKNKLLEKKNNLKLNMREKKINDIKIVDKTSKENMEQHFNVKKNIEITSKICTDLKSNIVNTSELFSIKENINEIKAQTFDIKKEENLNTKIMNTFGLQSFMILSLLQSPKLLSNKQIETYNYDDPFGSWGVWYSGNVIDESSVIGFFVEGRETDDNIINNLINSHASYNYSGELKGIFNNNNRQFIENGKFNFNINFGKENPINGNLEFYANRKYWNAKIDKSAIFNNEIFSNLTQDDKSEVKINSGAIVGKFYSNDATKIGGNFIINSDKGSVKGIFIGKKQ